MRESKFMDAPRLDSWSLHCLAVFVREQNVTRAGAVLGLSQPAASSILAKLRTTFSDPLLVKSPSGMVPTPRAIELRRQCERLLDDMRAMLEANADLARFQGTVTIAAIDTARALVLPSLLQLLAAEAPGICLRVHEVDRTRIHEQLENGSVDLGIGPSRVATGRLHYKQLWVDRAVLVASRSRLESVIVDAERLCDFQGAMVQTSRPSFYDDELDNALAAIGLMRRVSVVEKSYLMLPLLLEHSRLVAVVPERFGLYAMQRHAISITECPVKLPELSMGLYWHERTHRDSIYRWVRERITSCMPITLATSTESGERVSQERQNPDEVQSSTRSSSRGRTA